MSKRRRNANGPQRQIPKNTTTVKEDIEVQHLDSLDPPDFMKDLEGLSLSIPTMGAVIFGITALIVAIVAGAMLGQFYRTQLNRNSKINQDIAALQALVDTVMPPDHTGRFSDAEFTILNDQDLDKRFCFDAGNLTNGQKRFYTTQNKKGTLALTKQIPVDIGAYDATYLTLSADVTLINERSLRFDTSIFTLTDLGPGNAFVVDVVPTPAFVTDFNRANVTVDSKGRILFAITNLDPNTTLFLDSDFRVFDDTNVTRQMAFDCSGISAVTTRVMTVQAASGTVAYLSDIPTVFLDNAFAVKNAVTPSKTVVLSVAGVADSTIRVLSIQDAGGTIAYLSDIPTVFFDGAFAILNQAFQSKRAVFDASGIGLGMTRTFTPPNANGVLSLTAGVQQLTNKVVQSSTNQVAATYLKTTTLPVNIAASGPPSVGDRLTATSPTTAVWAASSSNGNVSSSVIITSFGGALLVEPVVAFVNFHWIDRIVFVFVKITLTPDGLGNLFVQMTLPVPRTSGNFPAFPTFPSQLGGLGVLSRTTSASNLIFGTATQVANTQQVRCEFEFGIGAVSQQIDLSYSYDLLN